MKVLLIEDDRKMAEYLAQGLRERGDVVDIAHDGKDGLFLAAGENYDVLVIDRLLPGLDGLAIVRTLRGAGNRTPILMLTALSDVPQRVEGLEAGADDYLGKPFAFSELVARLNALARRPPTTQQETTLRVADLEMDLLKRWVRRGERRIELLPTEFRILEQLMRRPDQVVTRTMLLEAVWDFNFDPQTNIVDVHISRLRRKIQAEGESQLIQTVRGAGYVLRSKTAAAR